MYKSLLITILASSFLNAHYWDHKELSYQAIVKVPVTDASEKHVVKGYDDFFMTPALCCDERYNIVGLRSYQPLFNEVVKVVQLQGDQACCALNNAYYYTKEGERSNLFWVPQKDIMYLNDLKEKIGNLNAVPAPYSENFSKKIFLKGILTLTFPWRDEQTGKEYSAGTRFVRVQRKDTEHAYAVAIIDFSTFKVKHSLVPKEHAFIAAAHDDFVKLLKQWTSKAHKIPYTWGGCSFISLVEPDTFTYQEKVYNGQTFKLWERPELPFYTGFDCATLILRAAQVCGMPYFCKTTGAALKNVGEFNDADTLEEGDLMWYPNVHIMVVGDIDKNELIEARGYPAGFGIVQSIHVSRFFKDIPTFEELLQAYKEKRPLKVLNKAGKVCKEIKEMKILKLKSIY